MRESQTADGRTETNRFDADATLDATDLIVGDRVDPSLVASTLDGLGHARSPRPDANPTQLAEATITNGMDDVHIAILVDGKTGVLVRASRHDSQSAWNQKEADWKVREVGTKVSVTHLTVAQDGDDDWIHEKAESDAEAWANVVLQDRALGSTDYNDELILGSRGSLTLYEPYSSTRVHATIELVDE